MDAFDTAFDAMKIGYHANPKPSSLVECEETEDLLP